VGAEAQVKVAEGSEAQKAEKVAAKAETVKTQQILAKLGVIDLTQNSNTLLEWDWGDENIFGGRAIRARASLRGAA
jgi:hypothetical protein